MPSPIIPFCLPAAPGRGFGRFARCPAQAVSAFGRRRSTYQETLLRVKIRCSPPPIVITGPNFHFFARRQAEEVGVDATVVIEPLRRDSAPGHRRGDRGRRHARSAGCGAGTRRRSHHSRRRGISRHLPRRPQRRRRRPHRHLRHQADRAENQLRLHSSRRGRRQRAACTRSKAFVEKPDAATAARYVREGYLWNSGNFLFRADVLLAELERLEPDIATAVNEAVAQRRQRSWLPAAAAGGLRARAARNRSTTP